MRNRPQCRRHFISYAKSALDSYACLSFFHLHVFILNRASQSRTSHTDSTDTTELLLTNVKCSYLVTGIIMDTSPLNRLPHSVRDKTYELVLCPIPTLSVSAADDRLRLWSGLYVLTFRKHFLAITATCKEIRKEASRVVSLHTVFRMF